MTLKQPRANAASVEAAKQEGPMESSCWPDKLSARALKPGKTPELFGFGLFDDIAHNLNFGETLFLALTGEEPTLTQGRAFNVLLTFLTNRDVGNAAVHSAVLARLIRSELVTAAATGFTVAADGLRAQGLKSACASCAPETALLLNRALQSVGAEQFIGKPEPALADALFALGTRLGLDRSRLQFAALAACLPVVFAEILATQPLAFGEYPSLLPPFDYRVEEPVDA